MNNESIPSSQIQLYSGAPVVDKIGQYQQVARVGLKHAALHDTLESGHRYNYRIVVVASALGYM